MSLFLVAWYHGCSLLFGWSLIQTVAGQHLTGWGLPSLRRAIAVQWDPRISPTSRAMAYNWYLLLHVLCPRGWRSWSVLSRCGGRCRWVSGMDVSLGSVVWRTGCCPYSTPSLPPRRWRIQRNSRAVTVWHQQRHRGCQNEVEFNDKLPYRLQLLIFLRGLLLKPFPKKGNCKATVVIARWQPLAPQNQRPLTDLVLKFHLASSQPSSPLQLRKMVGVPV